MELEERPLPRRLAGSLPLGFVNTIDSRWEEPRIEYLDSYAGLLAWSLAAHTIDEEQAGELLQTSQREPEKAQATLEQAVALRETIHRVFYALTLGRAPENDDLATIQRMYLAAMEHAGIVASDKGFAWGWQDEAASDLGRPLWPILRAAVELLTGADMKRIKECQKHGCGWLFLDTSKNNSRRWCSMEGCGSQVKMRRQYQRKKSAQPAK